MEHKFAAQLYTLREEMKVGIYPLFKSLKEMGWAGVQLSALPPGYDQKEVEYAIKENGLGVAGMHVSFEQLQQNLDGVLREADLYGTRDIVCPYISQEFQNEAGFKKLKEALNHIAREASDYRISYHNHAFEFDIEMNGEDALRYILEPRVDNLILAEVDVYWVKKGGRDPLEYIAPYSNRMPIIHLKDMTNDSRKTFAEIGTGVIDFVPILKWGEDNGVEWYAVDQDICERPPLDCLHTSLINLKKFATQVK